MELREWFIGAPNNIGIVTGELSGIAVVDLDTEGAAEFAKKNGFFDNCPRVQTANGYHLHFKFLDGLRNFQNRDDLPGIDLRAEGRYVVVPPSVHESGDVYRWCEGKSLSDIPLPDFPTVLQANSKSEHEQYQASTEHSNHANQLIHFLIYRRFSKKKVQPVVSDSEIQLIQKGIREFEADRRRSEFRRIK